MVPRVPGPTSSASPEKVTLKHELASQHTGDNALNQQVNAQE